MHAIHGEGKHISSAAQARCRLLASNSARQARPAWVPPGHHSSGAITILACHNMATPDLGLRASSQGDEPGPRNRSPAACLLIRRLISWRKPNTLGMYISPAICRIQYMPVQPC